MILKNLINKKMTFSKKTSIIRLRLVIILGLSLIFTGCGGDSGIPNSSAVANKNAIPTFTSMTEFTLDLGVTSVGVVSASDADGDPLTFSISRGDDQALFDLSAIDSASVQLDFKQAPDNGSFDVVILVNDGKVGVELEINVIVGCGSPDPDATIISDFECQQNNPLISSFDSTEILPIANTVTGGINPSLSAGEYVNPSSVDGSVDDSIVIDFNNGIGSVIDLTQTGGLKVQVLTSSLAVNSTLNARLQGGVTPVELEIALIANDLWTEYVFNFSEAGGDNTQLLLFFNKGNGTAAFTYHIDNIRFVSTVCSEPDLFIISDFECNQNQTLPDEVATVDNPDMSGVNLSAKVGEFTDLPDAWAASVIDFGEPIDLSTHNQLKMKIRSMVAVPLLGKLEGGTSGAKEIWTSIDSVGEWVDYTFDFSDQSAASHNKIALFFNGGVENAGTDVYQIDDIRFDCLADANIINDFDCQQNQPQPSNVVAVDNPDRSAVNPSAKVGELTDPPDAWSATVFDFGRPIDLTTHNQLIIKIKAPVAGPLLTKLEGGTSAAKEIWSSIDTIGTWVEYRIDFSDQATESHNKLAIFFNGGVENGGTDVYQIDDIRFVVP